MLILGSLWLRTVWNELQLLAQFQLYYTAVMLRRDQAVTQLAKENIVIMEMIVHESFILRAGWGFPNSSVEDQGIFDVLCILLKFASKCGGTVLEKFLCIESCSSHKILSN